MTYSAGAMELQSKQQAVPTQTVIGFPISVLSFEEHIEVISRWALTRNNNSRVVCVSNVHMLMEAYWNKAFSGVLKQADLLTPDGMPLVWVTRVMKQAQQDRVAGMELMVGLCQQAEALQLRVFFLGSTPEVLAKMQARLARDFPRLTVAGMVSPPFRRLAVEEDIEIVSQINRSGADFLFVAFGCPKQEQWMHEHRETVNAVMVGFGGAFSVFAGVQKWAPRWMRRLGLEWCYRLIQEPRRLWWRYAKTIPPFVWLAGKQLLKVRFGIPPEISLRKKYTRWLMR